MAKVEINAPAPDFTLDDLNEVTNTLTSLRETLGTAADQFQSLTQTAVETQKELPNLRQKY